MLINDWYLMYDSILKCINDNNIYSLSTLQKGWISKQKLRYKNKELSDEEINLLTDLGVDFKGSYLFKKKKKKVSE